MRTSRAITSYPIAATIIFVALGFLPLAHGARSAGPAIDISALPAPATGGIDFDRDIDPIFTKHCYACHGPKKQKAGLRLDVAVDALRGSDSGVVIVPGKSA